MSKLETINLPLSVYNRLVEDQQFLQALYAAGVDNWDGYDFALSEMYGSEEDEEDDE